MARDPEKHTWPSYHNNALGKEDKFLTGHRDY